jgi:hypothetical protein
MRRTLFALVGLGAPAAIVAFALLKPRPVQLSMTPRPGDDTVVVNAMHGARITALVSDQYGRQLRSDTTIQYRWLSGDSVLLSRDGSVRCDTPREARLRATFERLSREFILRCRPVAWIEAASWLGLVQGDSTRDLSFVARGPDGHRVTELRGAITVQDRSVVAVEGTSVRPTRPGAAYATVEIGDAKVSIPILVYEPVNSFVDQPKGAGLMAMRVTLARGDTIETPLPKAAFWVTYFSNDRRMAPPTIELRGQGSCSAGDGLHARRVEEGEYAKYCYAGDGARMMIAHGESGAPTVSGVVALQVVWK